MQQSDDPFGIQTTKSLLQLFKTRLYLPVHPFKLIIQNLLHDEIVTDSSAVVDYLAIPEEQPLLFIKLAVFGESECVGSRHLSKLINSASMKELKDISRLIRKVFGSPASSMKTERIEADFIEVFSVSSFLRQQVAQPRQHRVDMTVEVVIKGKTFDECLTLFIRRILEDASMSETAPEMLSSHLVAETGEGSVQSIDIKTMKAKRQHVLTVLKAAVVNDGDVSLEVFLRHKRSLLAFHPDSVAYREPSEGFIRVTRRYKLSYRNERNETRCFARHPLESLATGVFLSLKEAQLYLGVYKEQLSRVTNSNDNNNSNNNDTVNNNTTNGNTANSTTNVSGVENIAGNIASDNAASLSQPTTVSAVEIDPTAAGRALSEYMQHLSKQLMSQWADGEVVDATESMLLMHCILAGSRKDLTHCMRQLRGLTNTHTGHIRAVRDAVQSVRGCAEMLVQTIEHSPALANKARGLAQTDGQAELIDKYTQLFAALSPALVQVKALLLELVRVEQHSGVQYVARWLTTLLWSLFDRERQTHPIVHHEVLGVEQRGGLLGVTTVLQSVADSLGRIDNTLKMCELTIGVEVAMGAVRQDLQSYAQYVLHTKHNKLSRDRPENDIPRCFLDLMGFALAHSQPRSRSVPFVWRPLAVSDSLRYQLVADDRPANEASDRRQLSVDPETVATAAHTLWDAYALLGEYSVSRLGGVDFLRAVQDEVQRYDVPKFMALEGAKIRYLSETHVLRAFHEAHFFTTTLPRKRQRFSVFCSELFRFPAYLQLFGAAEDSLIEDFVFAPVRRNILQPTTSRGRAGTSGTPKIIGPFKIGLRTLSAKQSALISGGVFGPDRVLSALGRHADQVFCKVWNLPALFSSPPSSSAVGITLRVFSGVSLETALHWCGPEVHKIQAAERASKQFASPENNRLNKKSVFNSLFGRNKAAQHSEAAVDGFASSTTRAEDLEPSLDTGRLPSNPPVELEVVIKATYEFSEGLPKLRSMFAAEVGKCCRHMMAGGRWSFGRVVVHREPETTAELGTKSEKLSKVFSCAELAQDELLHAFKDLEAAVGKQGTAVVECSALVPDSSSQLSNEDLVSLFSGMRTRDDSSAATIATHDKQSSPNKTKVNGRATDFVAPNKNQAPDALNWRPDQSREQNDEDGEDGYSNDPTFSDVDRVSADSLTSSLINKQLGNKAALCYVPCRIRFTLLAQLTSRATWNHKDVRHSAPHYSQIIGHQSNPLTVGSDHAVARLATSTLWVSPLASRAVWSCVQEGETQCIHHQANERWRAYQNCLDNGDYCRAHEHALVSALLTQNYSLAVSLFRMANSLAVKVARTIRCVTSARQILQHSACSGILNASALGLTIARHICLIFRYLLLSPQCVHFRGGCAHILQCISRLERLLRLTPIEMSAALTTLPLKLLAYTAEETARDNFVIPVIYVQAPEEKRRGPPPPTGTAPTLSSISNNEVTVLSNVQLDRNATGSALSAPPSSTALSKPNTNNSTSNNVSESGENQFRKAVSSPSTVKEACALLQTVEELAHTLLFALGRDVHNNFPEVEADMKEAPQMRCSRDVMDLVVGENCEFNSLLSFIHRAESATNKQLEDAAFLESMQTAAGIKTAKSLRAAVLSVEAVDILNQIADLSASSTTHEKAALAGIVKSALRQQPGSNNIVLSNSNSTASLATTPSVNNEDIPLSGPTAAGSHKVPPHLANTVRVVSSLLSGLQTKSLSRGGTQKNLLAASDSTEKLAIETGGHLNESDDSMQCTPDQQTLHSSLSTEKLKTSKAHLFKEVASKLKVAKMFSLQEAENEESPRAAADKPRVVLSHFHNVQMAQQRHQQELDQMRETSQPHHYAAPSGGTLIGGVGPAHTFSSSGFQLVGDSVREAAESKSMLQLLRVYSGVQPPLAVADQQGATQLGGFVDAGHQNEGAQSSGSVLQALRSLPRPNNY